MPAGVCPRYVSIRLASLDVSLDTTHVDIRTGVLVCKWVGGRDFGARSPASTPRLVSNQPLRGDCGGCGGWVLRRHAPPRSPIGIGDDGCGRVDGWEGRPAGDGGDERGCGMDVSDPSASLGMTFGEAGMAFGQERRMRGVFGGGFGVMWVGVVEDRFGVAAPGPLGTGLRRHDVGEGLPGLFFLGVVYTAN